jgi:hypothetical protein
MRKGFSLTLRDSLIKETQEQLVTLRKYAFSV